VFSEKFRKMGEASGRLLCTPCQCRAFYPKEKHKCGWVKLISLKFMSIVRSSRLSWQEVVACEINDKIALFGTEVPSTMPTRGSVEDDTSLQHKSGSVCDITNEGATEEAASRIVWDAASF
jgi:hypothetical protein